MLGETECHVPLEQVTYEDWDHQGWAPSVAYPADIPPAVFAAAAEDEEAEGDEAGVPGKMSGWKGARDLMGLGDCQHVYCEKCDLNLTQDNDGCKVTSMALAGRVQRVLAKHEKLHQAKPWSDRDKREARHAVYKAIIHLLAVLLAARCPGKRVRLPECLVSQPNVRVRVRLLAAVNVGTLHSTQGAALRYCSKTTTTRHFLRAPAAPPADASPLPPTANEEGSCSGRENASQTIPGPVCLSSPNRATESPESCKLQAWR